MSGIWLGAIARSWVRQDILTNGNVVVPDWCSAIMLAGCGGGGGGGAGSLNGGGGGGGGAAAWTDQMLLPVTPGETLTVVIGAGGLPGGNGGVSAITGSLFGTYTFLRGNAGDVATTTNGASGGRSIGGYVGGGAGGSGDGGAGNRFLVEATTTIPVIGASGAYRTLTTSSAGGALTFAGGLLNGRMNGEGTRVGATGNATGGGGGHGGEGPFGTSGIGGNSGQPGQDATGYGCGGGGGGGDTATPANQPGGKGSGGMIRIYFLG